MTNVIKFNEDDAMSKDFNFKIGIEFSSMRPFKDSILKHMCCMVEKLDLKKITQ